MSDNIKRDYVSFLPPELLSEIFNDAFKGTDVPRAPFSRAFLPLQRRPLFHRLQVSSFSQLQHLVEAFEVNSGLGEIVKVVGIEVDLNLRGGGGPKPNDRQAKSFLSTLNNLEQLKLGSGATALIDAVLSFRVASCSLRNLRVLTLDGPSDGKKVIDSKAYRYLEEYPSLRRLTINANRDQQFSGGSARGGKLPNIVELVLTGNAVDDPRTLTFLQDFPNSFLVSALPLTLTSLALHTSGFDSPTAEPYDHHLPRLVNLKYLYLSFGSTSSDLIDHLRKLSKLKTLGFGKGVVLSCSKLEEAIIGPERIDNLEEIIFDQVEGQRGWSIFKDSDGKTLHPLHSGTFHLGPGWVPPLWSSEFKESDAVTVVGRIRAAGLKIGGTTIEAFGVHDDFKAEVMGCMMAYGWETGDFRQCRILFGAARVDEMRRGGSVHDGRR